MTATKDRPHTSMNSLRFSVVNGNLVSNFESNPAITDEMLWERLAAGHNAAAEIAQLMDKTEWDSDTTARIFELLTAAGFLIRDVTKQDEGASYPVIEDLIEAQAVTPEGVTEANTTELNTLLDDLSGRLLRAGYPGLNVTQRECAMDTSRAAEALDMVDDILARCLNILDEDELGGRIERVLGSRAKVRL